MYKCNMEPGVSTNLFQDRMKSTADEWLILIDLSSFDPQETTLTEAKPQLEPRDRIHSLTVCVVMLSQEIRVPGIIL